MDIVLKTQMEEVSNPNHPINKNEEEEEPDMIDGIYIEQEKMIPINEYKGEFTQKTDGINLRENIFDAGAIFRTSQQDED